jgi:type I restriction enzyme R subunit
MLNFLGSSPMYMTEAEIEEVALSWFRELGYAVVHGREIAPGEPGAERDSFGDVALVGRLRDAVNRLNPAIPEDAREDAIRKVLRVGTPSLAQTNRAFHAMLRDGVAVEYRRPDGSIAGDHVRLADFESVSSNDWLAVNQFTVVEGKRTRRPDIVVFLNGLPLAVIELKNAADEDATIWNAFNQLQTYKSCIGSLFSLQRGAGHLGRTVGQNRFAHGESGMVQGLARRGSRRGQNRTRT